MKCSRCEQERPADADSCPECGAKLAVVCVACGTANGRARISALRCCGNRRTPHSAADFRPLGKLESQEATSRPG